MRTCRKGHGRQSRSRQAVQDKAGRARQSGMVSHGKAIRRGKAWQGRQAGSVRQD
jgi:hypothetical protein